MGFTTPGGEMDAGMALFDFLRGPPIEPSIYNLSQVASLGNVIVAPNNNA